MASNAVSPIFSGQFSSLKELEAAVNTYESRNCVQLVVRQGHTVAPDQKRLTSQIHEDLVYAELKYGCIHGGMQVKKRERKKGVTSTQFQRCDMHIHFRSTHDGQYLEVKGFQGQHNHPVSGESYYEHAAPVRELPLAPREEVARSLSMKANKQQHALQQTGQVQMAEPISVSLDGSSLEKAVAGFEVLIRLVTSSDFKSFCRVVNDVIRTRAFELQHQVAVEKAASEASSGLTSHSAHPDASVTKGEIEIFEVKFESDAEAWNHTCDDDGGDGSKGDSGVSQLDPGCVNASEDVETASEHVPSKTARKSRRAPRGTRSGGRRAEPPRVKDVAPRTPAPARGSSVIEPSDQSLTVNPSDQPSQTALPFDESLQTVSPSNQSSKVVESSDQSLTVNPARQPSVTVSPVDQPSRSISLSDKSTALESSESFTLTSKPMHTASGRSKYPCSRCPLVCRSSETLEKHLQLHNSDDRHECPLCPEVFAHGYKLKSHHSRIHSGERSHACQFCEKTYNDRRYLVTHCLKIHYEAFTSQSSKSYRSHEAVLKSYQSKPVSCEICNAQLHASNLKSHMRLHSGDKPHVCSVCNARFACKSNLTKHLTTHSNLKPFLCDACGYRCSNKELLKSHARQHTGEKPFACRICGERFTGIASRGFHEKRHRNEKPYVCETCGKSFINAFGLKHHRHTHTGARPYACDVCSATFARPNALRAHRELHSGEKRYKCRVGSCDARFAQFAGRYCHEKTHHPSQ